MTDYLIDYSAAEAVRLPDGRIFRGPSCESNAARALLADGLPPDTRLVFCRNGQPSLRGGLTAFAARAWAGAEQDPAFRTWRPHPRQNARSALAAGPENGVACMGQGHPTGDHETALAKAAQQVVGARDEHR